MSARCQLCGEPMPAGEEMFKYHGFSSNCPKPPLTQPSVEVVVEHIHRTDADGELWLDIHLNRQPYCELGPFGTASERQRAHDDMLKSMRSHGATDLPLLPQ